MSSVIGARPLLLLAGGLSGIGLAAASRLIGRYDLVLIGRRDLPGRAAAVLQQLGSATDGCTIEVCDLADPGQVEGLRQRLKYTGALERLRGILHSAGVGSAAPFLLERRDAFERCMRDNYFSAVNLFSSFVPELVQRPPGKVVVIGSHSVNFCLGKSAYACSKAALESLALTLSSELVPAGVSVNIVRPGLTRTEMTRELIETVEQRGLARRMNSPLGRAIEPDEVAGVIDFLFSDDASNINGAVIGADGGSAIPKAAFSVLELERG